jgi:Mycothiol maleylpyruvate isomerase N-terminal domain
VTDLAAAYRGVRVRVRELVVEHGAECDTVIPATPEWTVHDLVAHLGGVTTDIVSGNLRGAGTDPWTANQVAVRRGRDTLDLLDEWDECAAPVEAMIESFGDAGGQLLFDAGTHEQDLRGALGCPGARDSDAVIVAFEWVVGHVGAARVEAGVGALQLEHEAGSTMCGDGAPSATLRITRFELTRAVAGRRSSEQVAAYEWDGEARPDLLVLARFKPRLAALVE